MMGLEVALLLLAAALRLGALGAQSLWYDEAFCWWVAARLPLDAALAINLRELVPSFTYLLLRVWIPLAGASELALRLPSALCGMLGVAAAARIVRRLSGGRQGRAGGIAALAFCALSPALVWAAREVRLYGVTLGLTLLSSMLLLETLAGPERRRSRNAWLWGALTLAALHSLLLSAFWLLGQGLWALVWLWRMERAACRRRLAALWLPALLVGMGFAPWLWAAQQNLAANAGYWPGHLPPSAFWRTALRGLSVVDLLPESAGVWAGALLLGIGLAAALIALRRRPRPLLYALSYGLPALALLCYLYRSVPKWAPRHAVLFAPATCLLWALAWGAAWNRQNHWPGLLALALATLAAIAPWGPALVHLYADPAYAHEDWRGAAAYVQAHRLPGDGVIVESGSVFPTWLYYADASGLLPLPDDDLLDVRNVLRYDTTAPLLNAALGEASQVWVIGWIADVTDPTDLVGALLDDLGTEQPLPTFHGLRVRLFRLERRAAFPAQPPLTVRYGADVLPGIRLAGAAWADAPHALAAPLEVRAWWQTDAPEALRDRFYQTVLWLCRAGERECAGRDLAHVDGTPGSGDYRPERWAAGAPVLGRYRLALPANLPPGVYSLALTLRQGETQQTAPLGDVQVVGAFTAGLPTVAAEAEGGPLRLIRMQTASAQVAPCATLTATLQWEVTRSFSAAISARISLGTQSAVVPATAAFSEYVWPVGERFQTRAALPIACRAADVRAPVRVTLLESGQEVGAWRGATVTISGGRVFTLPGEISPLAAQVGEVAELVGYRLEPPAPRAGQPFTVTLYWRAGQPDETPYTAFVHVTAPETLQPLAQHDGWPGLGQRASFTWLPGEIVADPHLLAGLPSGEYRLRVGLYAPDGVRLPISGAGTEENALVIPLWIQ